MELERLASASIVWKAREEEEGRLADGNGETGNADVLDVSAVKRCCKLYASMTITDGFKFGRRRLVVGCRGGARLARRPTDKSTCERTEVQADRRASPFALEDLGYPINEALQQRQLVPCGWKPVSSS